MIQGAGGLTRAYGGTAATLLRNTPTSLYKPSLSSSSDIQMVTLAIHVSRSNLSNFYRFLNLNDLDMNEVREVEETTDKMMYDVEVLPEIAQQMCERAKTYTGLTVFIIDHQS